MYLAAVVSIKTDLLKQTKKKEKGLKQHPCGTPFHAEHGVQVLFSQFEIMNF